MSNIQIKWKKWPTLYQLMERYPNPDDLICALYRLAIIDMKTMKRAYKKQEKQNEILYK